MTSRGGAIANATFLGVEIISTISDIFSLCGQIFIHFCHIKEIDH